MINDSGLHGYLLNLSPKDDSIGRLIEVYVGDELIKLASYEVIGAYTLQHFQTREKHEVDYAIESADRQVVGIDVRAAFFRGRPPCRAARIC